LKLFCLDLEATKTSKLTDLNRNTVNRYTRLVRERIAEDCERASPVEGEVEVDESHFGPRRVRGKRGRGASGKTIVLTVQAQWKGLHRGSSRSQESHSASHNQGKS